MYYVNNQCNATYYISQTQPIELSTLCNRTPITWLSYHNLWPLYAIDSFNWTMKIQFEKIENLVSNAILFWGSINEVQLFWKTVTPSKTLLFCTYIHVDIWSPSWYWVDCYLEVISDFIETISLSLKNNLSLIRRPHTARKLVVTYQKFQSASNTVSF